MDVLNQKRNGFSLADVAEIMQTHSDLKLQHGEPGYRGPWVQYLATKGITEEQWAYVWNDWWAILQGDPALNAKFHTYSGQLRMRGMIAAQPDVSQHVLEGVSLEQYAKISAYLQAGQDLNGLLAAERLTVDQWQRGQAAWIHKMSNSSPTDPVLLQYGQLYQKYNPTVPTAAGNVSMEQATEQILSKDLEIHGNRAIQATPENFETEFATSPNPRHRSRGAHEILNLWDRSSDERAHNAALKRATQRAYEVAVDLIANGPRSGPGTGPGLEPFRGTVDGMNVHQWGDVHTQEQAYIDTVTGIASSLKDVAAAQFMTPAQSEQAKAAYSAAIQRLTPRRARVEELFHGTQDMTMKSQLRSLLDDYTSLLGDLQDAVEGWSYEGPEAAGGFDAGSGPSFAPAPGASMVVGAPSSGGLLAFLRTLPIIGQILKALGL